jgi:Tfp pilus assembly protein PilN
MQYRDRQPLRGDHDRQVKLIVHEGAHPLQEIQHHLAAETGMDSVAVVGPCDCLADRAGAGPNASSHTPSAAALGAALRLLQAQGEDPRVNLVPAEVAQARRFLRRVLIAANVAALIFLAVLLVVQYLSRATDVMHQKLDQTRVSRQLHTMPALIAQEEFLDREISRIGQELGRLQVVRARHAVDWPRVLERARRAAPAEVSITHLGCSDGRSLSVRGFAPSSESARQFVRSLEDGGPFEAVSLARLERQPDSGDPLEYQIDCLLKATR